MSLILAASVLLLLTQGAQARDPFGGGDAGVIANRRISVAADAGDAQHVAAGDKVTLDGSRSISANGTRLRYSWSFVSKPASSAASLSDPSVPRPTFVADQAGDYVLKLVVRSRDGDAEASEVTVSTADVVPLAVAGDDRMIAQGATVGLDGSRSVDVSGRPLAYAWTLVRKPTTSSAALSATGAVRPQFTADRPGRYVARLVVTDPDGRTSRPAYVAFSTSGRLPAKPSAGPTQLVQVGKTAEFDADGTYVPSDKMGEATWALVARPAGSKTELGVGADGRATLTVDVAGDYVVQVAVGGGGAGDGREGTDAGAGGGLRFATTVVSTSNVAPVADAGAERRVVPGATVTLDGSRSTDVAGGALNYHWALISTPVGSAASLSAADAVRPDFVADIPGEYVAQLIVSDGTSQSRPSTVVISSVQSAPTAVAGRALLASPGADAALDGSASSDPNGDPLAARWSVLALGDQLAGSIVAPTSLTTAFKVPAAGVPLDVAVFNGAASVPVDGEDDGRCDDDCSPRLASVGRISRSGVEYTAWRIRNAADHPVAATLASLDGTFSKDVAVPARSDTYVVSPDVTAPASHEVVVGGLIVARADARADTFADSRLVGGGPALKLSIVQLEVSNALFSSHDDVVVATVEARPTAVASTSGPNYRGMVVTLDGAGSFNPNSTSPANGGLSYSWALLAKPPG
ncbi:MAG: hypothetical protein KGI57_03810, partial [Hyphomicrobiales bacterium]|nr:hypothetical protein [Hyphomicrobiales bacterium]